MSSPNGKMVAEGVKQAVRSGKKINYQEIQKKVGYSESSAKSMKGTRNKGFKDEMRDILSELAEERDAIIVRMKETRDRADYADLVRALDVTIKNIQLLGGRPTEIINDYSHYTEDELRKLAESKAGIGKEGVSETAS